MKKTLKEKVIEKFIPKPVVEERPVAPSGYNPDLPENKQREYR